VGLVARVLEEAGIPTVVVNMMPAYQPTVGMPRVAAVAHPFGRPFGAVGDAGRQRAVLESALAVLATATVPGAVVNLHYTWHEEPAATKWGPDEPSPIVAMLLKARGH